jgi:predicted negative regulator of RcsB-dependent stress response
MKKKTNRLLMFFAAIGIGAIFYTAWHYYQQQRAENAARAILTAPYPGDSFQNPGPPPRQP